MGVSIRAHAPLRRASVRPRVRPSASATAPGGRLAPWLDLLIALGLVVGGSVHDHRVGALGIALRLAMVAPLLLRRRAPVAVFALIWALAAVQGLLERPSFTDAALLVAFYMLASVRDLRTTLVAGAVLELGIILAVSWETHGAQQWVNVLVALSGLAVAAGVLGLNVQNRRRTLSDLRDRAERLERERERELALARVTERSRIAREMHDVVAHNLSVMVALCDGAGYHVHGAPERVESALQQASRTGRQALTEMRQLLGVLREPESAEPRADAAGTGGPRAAHMPELAPQPGIGRVDELVAGVRDAGLPVTWTLSGEPHGIPPGLELAVYRIVQEALTNTIKHAGAGASAGVRIVCAAGLVEVEVIDTGGRRVATGGVSERAAGGSPGGAGGGPRGMRERAAVYDGTLAAGPQPDGGWRVHASLRVPSAVAAAL